MDLNPMLLSFLPHSENKLQCAPNAQPVGTVRVKLLLVSIIMPAIDRDVNLLQKLPHAGTT